MARDFTKNTANYGRFPTLGALSAELHGAGVLSVAAWVYIDTYTASTASVNDILDIFLEDTGLGFLLYFDTSGANSVLKWGGRSQISDGFQSLSGTANVSTGAWHHVGVVQDIAGDAIRLYLGGSGDNNGAVTFGSATWVDSNDQVVRDIVSGNADPPTATSRQMDGRIAELAIWKGDIGVSGFKALAAGERPSKILIASLLRDVTMLGINDPEPDYTGALEGVDLIGTVSRIDHAPVTPPFGFDDDLIMVPAAVGPTIIGLATETSSALSITPLKTRAIGLSSETDSAFSIARLKALTLGLPTEADTAFGITSGVEVSVGLASETDSALAL
ncbi:hypothetical protein LCGC14_3055600, partial [marine sediment metagenome]